MTTSPQESPSPVPPSWLRESGAHLFAMFESAMDGIVTVDSEHRVVLFNRAAEQMFRCRAEDVLGEPLDRFIPARFRGRHARDVESFGDTGATTRRMGRLGPVSGVRADGEEFPIEASISHAEVEGRKLYTVILRDVTERVQAEAERVRAETELLRYQFELSELAQRLMTQEKTTTRRLAQALHDQLGQTLAAIRLGFDAAAGTPSESPRGDEALQRQRRLGTLIDQAIAEVRQVLVELRPPLLDDSGLAAALDNELRSREALDPGIDLLLEIEPEVAALRWPADVEYAAFMVAREALANARQHSGATLVRVVLEGSARALRLQVVDDGRGLEPGALRARPGHLGMVGMRERALAIAAHFSVEPAEEGGTVVRLAWENAA